MIPGAARTEVAGSRDGALLVRLAAPPEKGKANGELVACLAGLLGLPKAEVVLVAGPASRRKTLSLPVSAEAILRGLLGVPGH